MEAEFTQILDNISFKVNYGEICGLLGPNGSGKSTIFNLITGLLKPDFGEIYVNNTPASSIPIYLRCRKFNIGYCPQAYGYWSDLSLMDNLKAVSEILIKDKKIRDSRIEYLIMAAEIVKGKTIASNISEAIVVPGSGLVKEQAENEGLDKVFTDAGFIWRDPGCSMCLGMNPDQLKPYERCASTSNRNFEGRQGYLGRTHLMSPLMAAYTAINGTIGDPS